jgi:hypothetical protein
MSCAGLQHMRRTHGDPTSSLDDDGSPVSTRYLVGLRSGRVARARLDCMNLRTATNIFEL